MLDGKIGKTKRSWKAGQGRTRFPSALAKQMRLRRLTNIVLGEADPPYGQDNCVPKCSRPQGAAVYKPPNQKRRRFVNRRSLSAESATKQSWKARPRPFGLPSSLKLR